MPFSLYQLLLASLLFICLASFSWAMRSFFVRQGTVTIGLKLTVLAGMVFAILHFVVILTSRNIATPLVVIAAVLYLLSLAMFWWAITANRVKPLSACFSTNESLHLVQHGPYRLVRHPFYCSYLLTWLAGAVGTWSPWLGLTFIAMFVLYLSAARNEEDKFASSPLAESYAKYRSSTGRFIPSPFKLLVRRSR